MTTNAPGEMRRRSVYLRPGIADRMEQAITDLHYETRQPKHAVLAAIVAVALDHRDEVQARLTADPAGEDTA